MEGLLSLLFFGVLFYFMMRFGCGVHAVHGRHGHSDSDSVDPVCGMEVATGSGYAKFEDGRAFRFCSKSCLEKFETAPERFLVGEEARS